MSKLNFKQPYGMVYGHDVIRYVQDGKNYDATANEITPTKPDSKVQPVVDAAKSVTKVTGLDNAKAFLKQVLKENPLSKSAIFKEVENNNLVWNDVRDAAIELNINKFSQKNLEMWKLSEAA